MRGISQLALAALILLIAGQAHAQSLTLEMAKRHYQNGAAYYEQANYKAAMEEFNKAYKLEKAPELLYNLGRCHEGLGQLKQAISRYEEFLGKKPDAPNRATLELRVKNLQERLEAARVKPKSKPKPAAPVKSTGGSAMKYAGWAAVGVGAAALVTGAVLGAMASKKTGEYEDAWDSKMKYSEAKGILEAAEGYELGMFISLGVGGAVAVAGAVLLILDSRAEAPPRVALDLGGVSLRPTAGGFSLEF